MVGGCDSGDTTDKTGFDLSPAPRPEMAANGLSGLMSADTSDCDQPLTPHMTDIALGLISQYSCEKALTAQEIKQKCRRLGTFSMGQAEVERLSPSKRKYVVSWGGSTECPGGVKHRDHGTYEATVTKTDSGWIGSGIRTLTGPGNWNSQVRAK